MSSSARPAPMGFVSACRAPTCRRPPPTSTTPNLAPRARKPHIHIHRKLIPARNGSSVNLCDENCGEGIPIASNHLSGSGWLDEDPGRRGEERYGNYGERGS
jgi:hypothetical protein